MIAKLVNRFLARNSGTYDNVVVLLEDSADASTPMNQKAAANAAFVIDGFRPSSYTGKKTTDGTGVTEAVATGVTRILFQSLEVTGLEEFAVLAFGTSAANAIVNLSVASSVGTAGIIIRSGDSTAGGVAPDQFIGVPTLATHFALVDGVSGLTQVIMVTQGV